MEAPLPPPPQEFVCPISELLMADPVITPTGHTFERGCILAYLDLRYTPPSLSPSIDLSRRTDSSSLTLIPNINLKTAIFNWCANTGFPKPFPFTIEAAKEILSGLTEKEDLSFEKFVFIEPNTYRKIEPMMNHSQRSESEKMNSPFSPSSFGEIVPVFYSPKSAPATTTTTTTYDSFEDSLLIKLIDTEPHEQETALISLREVTREDRNKRISLCTSRMLEVLRRLLLFKNAGIQINAAASLVNLSLEASNKVNIVRAEIVPPLVELLINGSSELRDLAAGAIYSLSFEEKNRVAIGVLGAIPPLLRLLSTSSEGVRARRDAGMALYYLTLEELNLSKILRVADITGILLDAVTQREIRRPVLMVLANLAECKEGREGFIDGGAVEIMVALLRDGDMAPGSKEEEHCLRGLRGLSKASVRFRGMGRMAGAEIELRRVESSGGGARKEYAGRILRVLNGDQEDGEISSPESMYGGGGMGGVYLSVVSEMAGGTGQMYGDYRGPPRKSAHF